MKTTMTMTALAILALAFAVLGSGCAATQEDYSSFTPYNIGRTYGEIQRDMEAGWRAAGWQPPQQ